MQGYAQLGDKILKLWKAAQYDERRFAAIAYETLLEMPPTIEWRDVVKWAICADHLSEQGDPLSSFGQPPLTLFSARGFRIDALFWVDASISIHQHKFSGAFQVLSGSSIHTKWNFSAKQRISTNLVLGAVSFREAEILNPGDVRIIEAGPAMFHSTFHLEKPTVTIVVRTVLEEDMLPQYSLLPPSIAFGEPPSIVRKQSEVLKMLLSANLHHDYHARMSEAVQALDAGTVFHLLLATLGSTAIDDNRSRLLARARLTHPELLDAFSPAALLLDDKGRLLRLFKNVNDPDLQFFLALLLNVPSLRSIADLVANRYPVGRPIEKITLWVWALWRARLLGLEPSALLERVFSYMLQWALEPSSDRTFSQEYARQLPLETDLTALCQKVTASWPFNILFAGIHFDSSLFDRKGNPVAT